MIDKKKLIKTLRDTANLLEQNNLRYAHDRFIFLKMYKESTKLLNKFVEVKKLDNDDKCISL
jgi:hypothetical protein